MGNPLSWDNLTSTPAAADVFTPGVMIFFVVFAIGFVAAVYVANHGARRLADNPVKRRAIEHCARLASYVFGAGLFFFGVRALNINPFSFGSPIWLWLSVLALIVLALYCYRYARVEYPARLQAYEQRRLKQQYLQPTRGRSAKPPVPRPATAAGATRSEKKARS